MTFLVAGRTLFVMKHFFLGVGLVGAIFLAGCEQEARQSWKDYSPDPEVVSAPLVEENVTLSEAMIEVDVPETGVAAVDRAVQALIAEKTDEVEAAAEELAALGSAAGAGLYVTSEIFTATSGIEDVQSLALSVSINTGGVHPNQFFYTWTYRPERGEILKFQSLWQPGHNPLWTLASIVAEQVTGRLGESADAEWVARGAGTENFENYRNFVIDGRELVLFFEPYQVAAYAAGPQEVRVDLSMLQVVLAPPFLLGTAGGDIDYGTFCENVSGTWVAAHRECEWVSQQWCEQEMGRWQACASACRNDPTAEICTMQCAQVCSF